MQAHKLMLLFCQDYNLTRIRWLIEDPKFSSVRNILTKCLCSFLLPSMKQIAIIQECRDQSPFQLVVRFLSNKTPLNSTSKHLFNNYDPLFPILHRQKCGCRRHRYIMLLIYRTNAALKAVHLPVYTLLAPQYLILNEHS